MPSHAKTDLPDWLRPHSLRRAEPAQGTGLAITRDYDPYPRVPAFDGNNCVGCL